MTLWHWILIIIGIALFISSTFTGLSNYKWVSQAKIAEGEVIELIEKRKSKGKRTYRPRITYLVDGTVREYVATTGTNPPSHQVGEKVTMAYNDAREKQAIASFAYIYGFPLIGGMISLVILTGTLMFLKGNRILELLHPNLG